MFTPQDLDNAFSIFKHIQPKIADSMVYYKAPDSASYGRVVQYMVKNQIVAIWLDIEVVNTAKLKILFTRHKEVNHDFFIQQIGKYYRFGWKVRK
jgi:hypothetical protein